MHQTTKPGGFRKEIIINHISLIGFLKLSNIAQCPIINEKFTGRYFFPCLKFLQFLNILILINAGDRFCQLIVTMIALTLISSFPNINARSMF